MSKTDNIIESMLATRKKRQANIAIARTKIKHRPGGTPKYPNSQVQALRSDWIKSAEFKNITLKHLAVLHKMPVRTAQHMCYDTVYRNHIDAQPTPESLARAYAKMLAIQSKYDDFVKQDKKNIKSSKTAGQYSAADLKKLEKVRQTPDDQPEPDSDAVRALRNTGGVQLIGREQTIQCARLFFQQEGRLFDAQLIMELVKEIEEL